MKKTLTIQLPGEERKKFTLGLAQALAKKIANDDYQAEIAEGMPKP